MNKNLSKKLTKVSLFIIVMIALFMTIVGIEIITILASNKYNEKYFNNNTNINTDGKISYEIDDSKFTEITITDEIFFIEDLCSDGCKLKVVNNNENYYYMINKNIEGYRLVIIKDNYIILKDKYLGNSISKAYFKNYLGYKLFYNTINDGTYVYDYANLCNEHFNVDEFNSMYKNEMEFTSNGVIYYYEICSESIREKSKRIKAIRLPFNRIPTIIDSENIDISWC